MKTKICMSTTIPLHDQQPYNVVSFSWYIHWNSVFSENKKKRKKETSKWILI